MCQTSSLRFKFPSNFSFSNFGKRINFSFNFQLWESFSPFRPQFAVADINGVLKKLAVKARANPREVREFFAKNDPENSGYVLYEQFHSLLKQVIHFYIIQFIRNVNLSEMPLRAELLKSFMSRLETRLKSHLISRISRILYLKSGYSNDVRRRI